MLAKPLVLILLTALTTMFLTSTPVKAEEGTGTFAGTIFSWTTNEDGNIAVITVTSEDENGDPVVCDINIKKPSDSNDANLRWARQNGCTVSGLYDSDENCTKTQKGGITMICTTTLEVRIIPDEQPPGL